MKKYKIISGILALLLIASVSVYFSSQRHFTERTDEILGFEFTNAKTTFKQMTMMQDRSLDNQAFYNLCVSLSDSVIVIHKVMRDNSTYENYPIDELYNFSLRIINTYDKDTDQAVHAIVKELSKSTVLTSANNLSRHDNEVAKKLQEIDKICKDYLDKKFAS